MDHYSYMYILHNYTRAYYISIYLFLFSSFHLFVCLPVYDLFKSFDPTQTSLNKDPARKSRIRSWKHTFLKQKFQI